MKYAISVIYANSENRFEIIWLIMLKLKMTAINKHINKLKNWRLKRQTPHIQSLRFHAEKNPEPRNFYSLLNRIQPKTNVSAIT